MTGIPLWAFHAAGAAMLAAAFLESHEGVIALLVVYLALLVADLRLGVASRQRTRLLGITTLRGALPEDELARLARVSRRVVRARLRQLEGRGLVAPRRPEDGGSARYEATDEGDRTARSFWFGVRP